MPIFLIFLGVALMLLAWQNNQGVFISQVGQDFSSGFFPWFGAVLAIGALGYIPALKGFTRGILGLILLVFVLANGSGIFQQLQSAVEGKPNVDQPTATPPEGFTPSPAPSSVLGSDAISSILSGLGNSGFLE